jgi:hypothetical protein
MSGANSISLAALVIAFIAVISSTFLTWKAIGLNQDANHLPVILDLLESHRSPDFLSKEIRLWREIPSYDSVTGFSGLPVSLRNIAMEIILNYQAMAYTCEYGFADSDFVLLQVRYRLLQTWQIIKFHVEGERELRGQNNTFVNTLEVFVARAEMLDVDAVTKRLLRRGRRRRLS